MHEICIMRAFTIIVCIAVIVVTSCTEKEPAIVLPTVSKTIQFQVGRGRDYSLPVYQGWKANVVLTISRESFADGKSAIVWDTTFHYRSMQDFPEIADPFVIRKTIDGVVESKETIRVSRVLSFINTEQQRSQSASGETIPSGTKFSLFTVEL